MEDMFTFTQNDEGWKRLILTCNICKVHIHAYEEKPPETLIHFSAWALRKGCYHVGAHQEDISAKIKELLEKEGIE